MLAIRSLKRVLGHTTERGAAAEKLREGDPETFSLTSRAYPWSISIQLAIGRVVGSLNVGTYSTVFESNESKEYGKITTSVKQASSSSSKQVRRPGLDLRVESRGLLFYVYV